MNPPNPTTTDPRAAALARAFLRLADALENLRPAPSTPSTDPTTTPSTKTEKAAQHDHAE